MLPGDRPFLELYQNAVAGGLKSTFGTLRPMRATFVATSLLLSRLWGDVGSLTRPPVGNILGSEARSAGIRAALNTESIATTVA